MKTIAVFLADGFETVEALTPVDYLRRAKQNVITVAVKEDAPTETLVTSSQNVPVVADITLAQYLNEFRNDAPDILFCPGGSRGAVNLSNCDVLLAHLEKAFRDNKIVSAICASPAVVLGKTNILRGKKWVCYPNMQGEAKSEILENSFFQAGKRLILDGNVLTGQAEGVTEELALTLVEIACGKDEKLRIANACCVR